MAKRRRNRRNRHKHQNKNNNKQQPDVQNNSIVTTPLNRHTLTPINNFETPRNNSILQKKIYNTLIALPRNLSDTIDCMNSNNQFDENEPSKVSVDVSTQTAYFDNSKKSSCADFDLHSFAHIFETPRLRKDFSFFSPRLEARSTPIEAFNKSRNIFNMAKNLMKEKTMNVPSLVCTPTQKKVSNYYTAIFETPEKKTRFNSINLHRFHKSISPKMTRNVYIKLSQNREAKIYKRNRLGVDYCIPKSFSPVKRCTLEKSENFMNVTSSSIYGRIGAKVRMFHEKYSSRLAGKLLEICAWFGLTVKMGIVAMYKSKIDKKPPVSSVEDLYEARIDELERKISEMSKELEKLNTKMSDFEGFKKDFLELKKEVKKGNFCKIGDGFGITPPPPPPMAVLPPPPPPPLPPPMPLSTNTPLTRLVKPRNNRNTTEKENGRPVISLDDILKVKLRKTGDRQPTPRIQRRSTQPVVSMDMLKQVKLRPASRTPSTFINLSNTSTSPRPSSLTRILSKEKSQFKA